MTTRRPEAAWPVDYEYAEQYAADVADGREVARSLKAGIVGIARNAMPVLPDTLELIEEVRSGFLECGVYVYENDSTDETAMVLDAYAARPGVVVEHDTLGGLDTRGFEPDRTIRLAHCRNKCLDSPVLDGTSVTIVVDLDPQGGFSVDGVFCSLARLSALRSCGTGQRAGGMASYSLYKNAAGNVAQYDSWAARPNWWRDRRGEIGFEWFSTFLPPVGSPPVAMNSAFGGLGVYWTEAIRSSRYEGGDCEHVALHRGMAKAGWQMYLNPGCRYIAIWEE